MMGKKIVIDAPKHPVVRFRVLDDRRIAVDLRGIRNPHSPFNGGLNPTKGNQGRWVSPDHLQCMVNEYFESCNGPILDKYGTPVTDSNGNIMKMQVRPYTVSGLALYLGISTQTLKQYKEGRVDDILTEMRAETDDVLTFARVISEAKQKIESYAEGRLYDRDGVGGAKVVLDNCFGWVTNKERAEIEKLKIDAEMKQKEFELKKQLIEQGAADDEEFTINIVRGRKKDE